MWKLELAIIGGYLAWVKGIQLAFLTILTFFNSQGLGPQTEASSLQSIGETYASLEILIAAISAATYIALIRFLYPILPMDRRVFFNGPEFYTRFFPGFLKGMIVATALAASFLFAGYYQSIGVVVSYDELLGTLTAVYVRIMAICVLIYAEEYLLRMRLIDSLREHFSPLVIIGSTSLLFVLIKGIQFDLGKMHASTLFLISVLLGFRILNFKDFKIGAGFWAGALVLFHPILGLPILGNDFSGLLWIKYRGVEAATLGLLQGLSTELDSRTALFLTGGLGGPLSSFALQFILLGLVIRELWRYRNAVLQLKAQSLQ